MVAPRLQLKFAIVTAIVQSKFSATTQTSITFRKRFLTCIMVGFRVRVMVSMVADHRNLVLIVHVVTWRDIELN